MLDFLRGIEALAPVEALKASFYVYPLVNAAHIMAIGAAFTCVALMDLAILGLVRRLSAGQAIDLFRPIAIGAFGVAAATGILLFAVNASEYAFNLAFRLKMALLVLAGLNLWAFGRIVADGAGATTRRARASALASILLWTSILIAGRFIGFL